MLPLETMKKLGCLVLFLGIQSAAAVDFPVADQQTVRQLADKFSVTPAQEQSFLSMAKNLVGLFSAATSTQRDDVIGSLEDARYGGTMPDIQKDLDSLLATAKATPAGVTVSASSASTGSQSSAATPTQQVLATYLDRIAGLSGVLDSFRFKQVAEADKAQVMTLMQGLYNDRADSFSDERQRLVQVFTNAKVLMFRDDTAKKTQTDSFISGLSAATPFDVQLTYQKKLYSVFSPLTQDQKSRVLRHFQEMAQMVPTLTDISLNNDFRDLLQFSDVAFFQDDANSHSIIQGLLSKVQQLDPIFSQAFGDIITSLKNSAPTLATNDLQTFMTKVQTLTNMRYGNKPADLTNKAANASALQDFLNYLIGLPPFSSYVPQLTVWLGMVKADNVVATTTSRFIDQVNAYLSQDFMVQTSDATKRASFMTNLAALMNSRYGTLATDTTPDAIAQSKQKLNQLLYWMTQISWFSDSLTVINGYIAQVAADPATGPTAGTTTATGIPVTTTTGTGMYNVVFGQDLGAQLTQLEQSLPLAVNDNQKEMFMLSLFEVVQRKTGLSSADTARTQTLINNVRNSANFSATFSSYCTFLQAGLNAAFDENTRIQVYFDSIARVAGMPVVADVLQTKILDLVQYLVENSTRLSLAQATQLGANMSAIITKNLFSAANATDMTDMYTQLSMNLSGQSGSSSSAGNTSSSTSSSSGLAPLPSSSTTSSSNPVYANQQQMEQTRVLMNARALSMR